MNRTFLASLSAAFVIAGCGGHGSAGSSRNSPGREAIRRAIGRAISVSPNSASGIAKSALAKRGYGVSLEPFGTSKAGPKSRVEADFDENLQLWRTVTSTGTTSTAYYWVDEAGTLAAGSKVTTFPASNAYPMTITSTLNLTAGPYAGSQGTTLDVQDSEAAHHSSADYSLPGNASMHVTDQVASDGTKSWTIAANYSDSTSFQCSGSVHHDGSGTMTMTGNGTTTTMTYAEDTTGDGTVVSDPTDPADPTAPADPTTPPATASFAWTADGTTTIHYSDGTSETIAP